jgi:hypothetical protein
MSRRAIKPLSPTQYRMRTAAHPPIFEPYLLLAIPKTVADALKVSSGKRAKNKD